MSRAAVPVPTNVNEAYFFHGAKYSRAVYAPGLREQIITSPTAITAWKSLAEHGFDSVDAALPVPGYPGEIYFFRGTKYIRIKLDPNTLDDSVVYGPASIAQKWTTLHSHGFETVDAILPVPGHENEAYFFSGNRYIRIKFVPSTSKESVIYGPASITEHWLSLSEANFDTVDAALPVPGEKYQAYFFSGSQYVRVKYQPNSTPDSIVYGPRRITEYWESSRWGW
ncbi:hypothetical protein VTI28DRAFT_4948 [Corynascus sepedonium]